MILQKLPKITLIEGGVSPLESPEFMLDNYAVTAFLFENSGGGSLTVKVMANTEGGDAEPVPFLLKAAGDGEYENVKAEGKTLTAGGAFVAVVTADSLAHKEFDRAAISIESDGDLTAVYALQTQPRYEDNDETAAEPQE